MRVLTQVPVREMNKRIQIIPIVENVFEGQVTRSKGTPINRWASLYQQIGKEMMENGKTTGTDRIYWTLRKDSTLFNITGLITYNSKDYEITSVRELDNYTMQIICYVKF